MNYEDIKQIPVTDVVFRDDLYPRIERDPRLIQQYSENLEVMPPIELNQHNELIDGFHRWKAHQMAGLATVPAIITETESEKAFLRLACERNARHGYQLTNADKQRMARRMYHSAGDKERHDLKRELPSILSVSPRTFQRWVSEIDKDTRAERQDRAFQLWLACHTQEQIAEDVRVPQRTVSDWLQDFSGIGHLSKTARLHAEFMDYSPSLYNVWNSEQNILENLLYAYTEPFDVVVDPFAGGGSTIDVCRARFRRYHVSDLTPIVSRENEIRQNDLTEQLPDIPRWTDVKLVYLDPPQWRTSNPTLASMELDAFHKAVSGIVNRFADKLRPGTKIAMLMQPTQWKAPNKAFTDHLWAISKEIDLPLVMRCVAIGDKQDVTEEMIDWAKQPKSLLVITRDIVIWEKL